MNQLGMGELCLPQQGQGLAQDAQQDWLWAGTVAFPSPRLPEGRRGVSSLLWPLCHISIRERGQALG